MSPSKKTHVAFGIDIGGSGIKGAPVDLTTGTFMADRRRDETPQPSTPGNVAAVITDLVESFHLPAHMPIGVTFPGVVTHGIVRMSANMHDSWVGTNLTELVSRATARPVTTVNDADAAGYAEVEYGAAKGLDGLVLVTTLGTGIGSALISHGQLVPNTELGHVELDGHDYETRAAASVKERKNLSWAQWAERLQRYYSYLEDLLWPDLIVVGGGVSKKHEKFLPLLSLRAPIVPAQLRNDAGIVGAAALAYREAHRPH